MRGERIMLGMAVFAGALLAVIGARFLISPEAAARTFGLAGRPEGFELHHAVGLRDLWLGLLAVALAWARQWRALALWFAFGAAVCLGDAVIAGLSRGRWPAVAFHVASGIVCAVLALRLSVAARRADSADAMNR